VRTLRLVINVLIDFKGVNEIAMLSYSHLSYSCFIGCSFRQTLWHTQCGTQCNEWANCLPWI